LDFRFWIYDFRLLLTPAGIAQIVNRKSKIVNLLLSYLLPDDELFELLFLDDDELELLDFELSVFDERLGVVLVEVFDERLGVVLVEVLDERLGVVVVEVFDERLGVVVFVEVFDERLGVADVPEDGFLVPALVEGFVVVVELREGVELVALLLDCRVVVVSFELLDGVLDELLVTLLEGRVELVELLDGVDIGRA
jgi:hypothetical protein